VRLPGWSSAARLGLVPATPVSPSRPPRATRRRTPHHTLRFRHPTRPIGCAVTGATGPRAETGEGPPREHPRGGPFCARAVQPTSGSLPTRRVRSSPSVTLVVRCSAMNASSQPALRLDDRPVRASPLDVRRVAERGGAGPGPPPARTAALVRQASPDTAEVGGAVADSLLAGASSVP
jgi:hypothetical protein